MIRIAGDSHAPRSRESDMVPHGKREKWSTGHEMTKKLHLSPAEREVLWVLRESEEENLSALVNAMQKQFPTLSRGEMVMASEKAMRDLYRKGLIEVCVENLQHGRRLDLLPANEASRALAIAQLLKWDEDEKRWNWSPDRGDLKRTVVVLTQKGSEALRR